MKMWYCPACGWEGHEGDAQCKKCGSSLPFIESKYDWSVYVEEAERRNASRVGDVFWEEVKQNPQFDPAAFDRHMQQIMNYKIKPAEYTGYKEPAPSTQNCPRCPTCQSTNIKKISVGKRAIFGAAFGLLSKTARSQFECMSCGYKW